MGVYGLNILFDFQMKGLLEIVSVIVRNDDDEKFWYQSVSKRARELNVKLLIPSSINDDTFIREVSELNPDIGFCCFYPQLFKKSFFSIPKVGFFNLHFAPLPKYRGALPIPFAIISGESQHGVTIHKINEGIDSGPIVAQSLVEIFPYDTGYDLYKRCEQAGIALFQKTIQRIVFNKGNISMREQNEHEAFCHVRKDLKSLEVMSTWDFNRIYNFVRAFDFPPFELPYMKVGEKQYRLTIRPDRHDIHLHDLTSIGNNEYKVFMIDESHINL